MVILTTLFDEVTGFFGFRAWITMILFLMVEIVRALWTKTFRIQQYGSIFLIYSVNRAISLWLSLGAVAFTIGLFMRSRPSALGSPGMV